MGPLRCAVSLIALTGCNLYFEASPSPDPAAPDAAIADAGAASMPTAVTEAYERVDGAWQLVGPADWSCWRTPSGERVDGQVRLTGAVVDWQTGAPVGAARISGWGPVTGMTLGGAETSSAAATLGRFELALAPLGPFESHYRLEVAAGTYANTTVNEVYLAPGADNRRDVPVVSSAALTALPRAVGRERDPRVSTAIGDVVDCQGRAVANALAVVSQLPSFIQREPTAQTYYAIDGLPTTSGASTGADGRFFVFGMDQTIATLFMQVWGFRDAAELAAGTPTLLSLAGFYGYEVDTVHLARLAPRRLGPPGLAWE